MSPPAGRAGSRLVLHMQTLTCDLCKTDTQSLIGGNVRVLQGTVVVRWFLDFEWRQRVSPMYETSYLWMSDIEPYKHV